jgi:radical S-adenosyl methionine domain-containing protein 2
MITNGSRLNPAVMLDLAPHLSVLGLSLDSCSKKTNWEIGRADRQGGVLPTEKLPEVLASARRLNPQMRVKINTVVNALNWREDMSDFIGSLAPDKWKVLRMLPTVTDDLAISHENFQAFVRRHDGLGKVLRAEDNSEMAESYLMIDPHGRFFQNALGRKGYDYSAPIIEAGAPSAFSQISVSSEKFCARYTQDQPGA